MFGAYEAEPRGSEGGKGQILLGTRENKVRRLVGSPPTSRSNQQPSSPARGIQDRSRYP
jgi:hypothetical protein